MAKILVVEDEMLVRQLLCDDLTDDGHAVIEAPNGDAAVNLLEAHPDVELLLTDIRMPGAVDGWNLGKLANQSIPGIRIIYATGYSEEMPRLRANERMLKKPFLHCEVQRMIAEVGLR